MNANDVRLAVYAAGSVLALGTTIAKVVHTHQTETAKRRNIEENSKLEIAAIRISREMTKVRIKRGEFRGKSFAQIEQENQRQQAYIRNLIAQ